MAGMNEPFAIVYCEHCPNHASGSVKELAEAGWYLTHDLGITICKECDHRLTQEDQEDADEPLIVGG